VNFHAINDEKWFILGKFRCLMDEEREKAASMIANGLAYPEAVGWAAICLEGIDGKPEWMVLKVAMFHRHYPLNIFSGERFYLSGGYLACNTLMQNDEAVAQLDVRSRSFFMKIYGSGDDLTVREGSHSAVMKTEDKSSSRQLVSQQNLKEIRLWHRCLAHTSDRALWKILKMTKGGMDPKRVASSPCSSCEKGKSVAFTPLDLRSIP
jgi:gag-pre-integrase-like protein